MNAQVKIPDLAELVVVEEKDALATFTTPGALDPILAHVRKHIDAFSGDASTKEGREQIKKMAFAVTKSKTALKEIGDRLAKEAKELPGKIDKGRKLVNDTLDAWRDEVRKPLTDWELAEEARVDRHTRELEQIKSIMASPPGTVGEIESQIAAIETYSDGPDREEFQDGFRLAKANALATLRQNIEARKKYDQDQAELAKLRAEREAREAEDRKRREAEDAAKREQERQDALVKAAADAERREREAAEKRAQAEREAAERREAELHRQAADAERRAAEAEARAKADLEAKAAAERAEQERREKDKAHRGAVNRAAVNALVEAGIPEDHAKAAITAIAKGSVPAVRIHY